MNMKRILILPNAYKDEDYAVTRRIVSFLTERGAEVYAKDGDLPFLASAGARALGTLSGALRLIISVGGDGTVLASAGEAIRYGVPLLGVNMGRLGFLAELDAEKIDRLERLFTGEYRITSRMTLSVIGEIDGERTPQSVFPLNDVVLSHDRGEGLMELSLSDGEGNAIDYHADGLILATPSGSTAYSLSAGGPIADPRINCLCVTPICSHSLTARPLVFPDSAVLEIRNTCQREKMLYVTVDGRINYELYRGNVVRITRSPMVTTLIRLKKYSFYHKLRSKMNKE
jgi:NAD+ kinase